MPEQQKIVKWQTPDSKDVTLDEGDDGATRIRVPISSTSQDRDGDKFTRDGLDDLMAQLESGEVPLYLDHGLSGETGWREYRVEDMIGGWVGGEIEERDGSDMLFGIARLEPDNDQAEMLASKVENELPVGFSVGFIPELESAREMDDGGLKFNVSDLLETSAVGIPSNPDAVMAGVQMAKALSDKGISPTEIDHDQFTRMVDDETQSGEPEEVDDAPEVDETNDAEETDTETSNDEADELVNAIGEEVGNRLEAHRTELLSEVESILEAEDDDDEDGEEDDSEEEDDDEDDEKDIDLDELKAELVGEVKSELLNEDLSPEDPSGIVTTTNGAEPNGATTTRWNK